MNRLHPLSRAALPTLAIFALLPTIHGQELFVESFTFPTSNRVSITAKGLPAGPATLRMRTGPDLASFSDADFPFYTDLGGGRFSLRGNYDDSADRAFFQVQVDPGSASFTPDLSLGVASRSEENGFGAWQVKTADNAVYTGGIQISLSSPPKRWPAASSPIRSTATAPATRSSSPTRISSAPGSSCSS